MTETAVRTCPLCEATCGLEIELDEGRVIARSAATPTTSSATASSVRRAPASVTSTSDPDRLTTPLVRDGDGEPSRRAGTRPSSAIDAGLGPILADGDRNAIGAYIGNPNAHTLDGLIHLRALLKALGSKNVFSASTVDQMPKQISAGLMFGAGLSVPIPDLDRTDHLLILGANPLASNGA